MDTCRRLFSPLATVQDKVSVQDKVPSQPIAKPVTPKLLSYTVISVTMLSTIIIVAGIIAYCFIYKYDLIEQVWHGEEAKREAARLEELKRLEEQHKKDMEIEKLMEKQAAMERDDLMRWRAILMAISMISAIGLSWLCLKRHQSMALIALQPIGHFLSAIMIAINLLVMFKYSLWTSLSMLLIQICCLFGFLSFTHGSIELSAQGRIASRFAGLFEVAVGAEPRVKMSELGRSTCFVLAMMSLMMSIVVAIAL